MVTICLSRLQLPSLRGSYVITTCLTFINTLPKQYPSIDHSSVWRLCTWSCLLSWNGNGMMLWAFIKSWTEVARGDRISLLPNFSSQVNVIKLASELGDSDWTEIALPEAFVKRVPRAEYIRNRCVQDSKRPHPTAVDSTTLHISFDLPMQKKLKDKALEDSDGPTFSASVVISAHVWRAIIRARLLADTEETRYFNNVDCRKRWPELPENYFGNAVFDAVAVTTVRELLGKRISYAANLLRKTIADLTAQNIKSVFTMMEKVKKEWVFIRDFRPSTDVRTAASVRFPGPEQLDFGWGSAFANIIVFSKRAPRNIVSFTPKHTDGTIEINFRLPEDAAKRLQEDSDFMSCVSSVTAVTLG